MTRRLRPALLTALLALLAAVLPGCGLPAEQRPRQIKPPPGPFPTFAAAPASTAPAELVERLCFVRDNRLVAVSRPVPSPPTIAEQLRHLLSGPTAVERDAAITSALTGAPAVGAVAPTLGAVTVDVGGTGADTGRSDEALAYGQLVCTLTGRPDVTGVIFVRDGQRLRVPRADGSLSEGPLTAADYAEITTS
ncbi:Sporulation and spore germination [Micromonospora pattaloongensis]|uniref:Sporulation and spore germination n=1 Tax=Micromonospora pattaloongensis TaxID=405436 RepID=A0A1H3QQ85_9ACTN|nr:GerMN domain-containing protein [Micromonospora pattaloongensis]SDZ15752.1 Sporulation and spore germination [Micromonospora pattaloongensis]